MVQGKKYIVGHDVVLAGGAQTIKSLQDSEDDVNAIYFDRKSVPRDFKDDYKLREFLDYPFRNGRRSPEGFYEVGDLQVHLSLPEDLSSDDFYVMTEEPELREQFFERGITDQDRFVDPHFLIQDPKILERGLIRNTFGGSPNKLEDRINLAQGNEMFENPAPFINQFVLLSLQDGTEALYQLRQEFDRSDSKRGPKPVGEPFYSRLEKEKKRISRNEDLFCEDFGVKTADLNQYLAYKYLLLNPDIQMVILSGVAGTGKTLLPYMAALRQTVQWGKDGKKPLYNSLYLCKSGIKIQDHDLGHLPGDLNDKLGPGMEPFEHTHDVVLGLPPGFTYAAAKQRIQQNKFNGQNIYLADNNHILIHEKAINFMRGVTISDGFIIYDEVQNTTRDIAKLLATRIGPNSKVVVCGDPFQTDDKRKLTPKKNGLVYLAHEHMNMGHPYLGVMNLVTPKRGDIAAYSSRMTDYRD